MEQQKTKESKKRYFAYDLMRATAMLLIVFYQEADLSKGVKQLFLTATAVLLCVLGVAVLHSAFPTSAAVT